MQRAGVLTPQCSRYAAVGMLCVAAAAQGSRVSAKNKSAGFFAKNNPTLVSVEPTLAGQETGVDCFSQGQGQGDKCRLFSRSQPAWRQV